MNRLCGRNWAHLLEICASSQPVYWCWPQPYFTVPTSVHSADTLATYHLGQGWATFGLVLPQGAARGGVGIGDLRTQTDVKTTWEDGSIRFAVVTAQVREAGTYAVSAGAPTAPVAKPAEWPTATVELEIEGTRYLAPLPRTPTNDVWLSGSEVHEARALVTPMAGGTPHPFLRVRYDVRTYCIAEGNDSR